MQTKPLFIRPNSAQTATSIRGPVFKLPLENGGELKEVAALDVLNPAINRSWYPKTQGFTLSEYFRHIKLLYTRENILAAPDYLNNARRYYDYLPFDSTLGHEYGSKEHYVQAFRTLFKNLPDDIHWILHFLNVRSIESNTAYFDFYNPNGFEFYGNELMFSYRSSRITSDYRDNSANTLVSQLKAYAEQVEADITPYLHRQLKTSFFKGIQPFSQAYMKFLADREFYYSSNGTTTRGTHPTSELAKALESPGSTLSFVETGYNPQTVFSGVALTQKVTQGHLDPLYKVFEYSQSPLVLIDWPLIVPNETAPNLYGVELECTTDYSVKQIIDASPEPFFIAKKDSSISGSKLNKMELVTIPMSLKALKKAYAHWFTKLDYKQFDCSLKTGNGMHVHIGRTHFHDESHIQRFCWFFHSPANTEFIVTLSERGSLENMASYTPIYRFNKLVSKYNAYKNIIKYLQGQRGATNLGSGKGTIEVRIFKGIVSYASIIKNLEAVDAIFHYTSDAVFTELNVEDFISWLNKTPSNKYQVLKKFVSQIDTKMIFAKSDITDIIWTEEDPEKIFEKIKKSGLHVTNAHVSVLNQGRKRTFVIDKATGEFKLKIIPGGQMAWMDRELEKTYTREAREAAA